MVEQLKRIWQFLLPSSLFYYLRFKFASKNIKKKSQDVIDYYKNNSDRFLNDEMKECLRFLKKYRFESLPYKWALKYEQIIPDIIFDVNHNCYFVYLNNKKLYFKKGLSKRAVLWIYRSCLKEQDPKSAHVYETEYFQVEPGSIVVDAGVAEGNFGLSIIDKVKKLILIECEPEWMEALKLTFDPWKDKVIFVQKYLSDTNDEKFINLDQLLNEFSSEKVFIKMDIEGFEKLALKGASNFFKSNNHIKLDVCTYHNLGDVEVLGDILNKYALKWEVSSGYIIYMWNGSEPCLRRALIRAQN